MAALADRGQRTRAAAQRVAARDPYAASSEIEREDELWNAGAGAVRRSRRKGDCLPKSLSRPLPVLGIARSLSPRHCR